MTPLKVGEPFAGQAGMAIPSQAEGDLGRCRDWTGGTYSARRHGEGTVQTTNALSGAAPKGVVAG
jgi:hypothetical protein